ncbi:MAG: AI-2E family transporter [Patescibacteria group bacterium]
MNSKSWKFGIFLIILTLIGVLLFFIIKPFVLILLLTITLAIIFRPIYLSLSKYIWPSPAAGLTLLLVVLIVILPTIAVGLEVFNESRQIYWDYFTADNTTDWQTILDEYKEYLEQYSFIQLFWPENINLEQIQEEVISWIYNNANTLISSLTKTFLNLSIFLFAFFYLIRDADKLKKWLFKISPLNDNQNKLIKNEFINTVKSIMNGSIFIAILQGVTSGIGFLLFGLPQPVLWGALSIILSLIPGIGASLILLPAAAYLLLTGSIGAGIGLIIWAVLVVGLMDNFLRPILIEKGTNIHAFLVLISALGGIALFGPIGFILGPIIAGLFLTLTDIYSEISNQEI